MKSFFAPHSVAVIGASTKKNKLGYILVNNILSGGYNGKVYPVNPAGGELLGLKVYPDLDSINDEIDVAAILIPASKVFETVKQCVKKRVKYGVIITSGFSETGKTEEERKIVNYAAEHGMRILGPNVLGYYSAESSLNMTFGLPKVTPGEIAVISQSGGVGYVLVSKTKAQNIRLSAFLSIGNKADISESELVEYLAEDERTKVILIYMEGVKDGARFIKALKKATGKKPVIIIKAGNSSKGVQAAASHTGALACPDEIFSAVIKQCNALRTDSLEEALDWSCFFVNTPLPEGDDTLIITNGGGLGVMAVDALEKRQVKIYDCQDELKKTFSPLISEFGSYKNPVDLTSAHDHETYNLTLKAAIDNKNIHAIMVIYCHIAADINKMCEVFDNRFQYCRKAGKALTITAFGNAEADKAMNYLRGKNVPVFDDFLQGASCLEVLFKYARVKSINEKNDKPVLSGDVKDRLAILMNKAVQEKRNFLLAGEARELLEIAGIEQPAGAVVSDAGQAVQAAEKTGYPAVMKVVSPDILHKSDAGGVLLNLKNEEQIKDGFSRIRKNCLNYNANARFHGVEVSRMLKPGLEIIVGARRDASFGPIVMCGFGGIYVEVLKDVVFRAFPITREEGRRMLKELKAYPLLAGARNTEPLDVEAVVDTLLKTGEIILTCPEIADLELNPVFVYSKGLKAVDARVMLVYS